MFAEAKGVFQNGLELIEITGFLGCLVDGGHNGTNLTLTTCCMAVGSSPVSANGSYGCPFNSAFPPENNSSFIKCALEEDAESVCVELPDKNNVMRRLRMNFAMSVLFVGVLAGILC
ncbi:hypothetical protein B0H13DRAFT_1907187 [Mycena leptocephala]|nr:hypothetical protein B0H13DRAFT_1907187 [Mycena leptocephala]